MSREFKPAIQTDVASRFSLSVWISPRSTAFSNIAATIQRTVLSSPKLCRRRLTHLPTPNYPCGQGTVFLLQNGIKIRYTVSIRKFKVQACVQRMVLKPKSSHRSAEGSSPQKTQGLLLI